jgi:hypothetical protein
LTALQSAAQNSILHWASATHSVLAPNANGFPEASLAKVRLAAALLGITFKYTNLCLDTTGMVLTAVLVFMVLRGQKPNLFMAVNRLRSYPARVLWYSFLLFALSTVLSILVDIPVFLVSNKLGQGSPYSAQLLHGEVLVTALLSAWIMAPLAVALLRTAKAAALSTAEKEQARYSLVLTTAVVIALSLIFDPWVFSVTAGLHSQSTIVPLALIVLKFPYVMAFVALALIAGVDSQEDGPVMPSRLKEFFKGLMPMHSGNDDQA